MTPYRCIAQGRAGWFNFNDATPAVGTDGATFCVGVYFETIDGVLADAPDLAIRKAKTSALWRRPTEVFKEAVDSKKNSSYADGSFQDMTTSPGGVPLFKDGRVVGGFGIADTGSAQAGDKIDAAVVKEAAKLFGSQ